MCLEYGRTPDAEEAALLVRRDPEAVPLATKSDLSRLSSEHPAVSAVTGEGLESLRALLAGRAEARSRPSRESR